MATCPRARQLCGLAFREAISGQKLTELRNRRCNTSTAAAFTLVTVWVFKLFPSIDGAGQRLLRWLCTYGPLWPANRVIRVGTLDRLTSQLGSPTGKDALEKRLQAALEQWALLAPVMEGHPRWFVQGYIDAEGEMRPYHHRFVEFRIKWSLFWRGESYGKFQSRLNGICSRQG